MAKTSRRSRVGKKQQVKVTRACDICKTKKKRCTGDIPCTPCRTSRSKCTYDSTYSRGTAVPPSSTTIDTEQPSNIDVLAISAGPSRRTIFDEQAESEPPADVHSDVSLSLSRDVSPESSAALHDQYQGPSNKQNFLGQAIERLHGPHIQANAGISHREGDRSTLAFGDRQMTAAKFEWPSYERAKELLSKYYEFVSPTYWFTHRPTVEQALSEIYIGSSHTRQQVASRVSTALVLLLLAGSSLYRINHDGTVDEAQLAEWHLSEAYFVTAQRILKSEKGPPTITSAQARFATVQYLMSTSRPSRAMYEFATLVQLITGLGLHRQGGADEWHQVQMETRRRVFWCAYTFDKYLSIVMGRPPLLRRVDCNQSLPRPINDEDLMDDELVCTPNPRRDCLLWAAYAHAKLGVILETIVSQHSLNTEAPVSTLMDAITAQNQSIYMWQCELPPFLSEAIRPTSLVLTLRRQNTILRLARLHASIVATRSFLVLDISGPLSDRKKQPQCCNIVVTCLVAAKSILEIMIESAMSNHLLSSFWCTQYFAFSALSVVYIYLIQLDRKLVPEIRFHDTVEDCDNWERARFLELYYLAREVHIYLARASSKNAPAWRYDSVLKGLRAEADVATSRLTEAVEAVQTQPTNCSAPPRTRSENAPSRDAEGSGPTEDTLDDDFFFAALGDFLTADHPDCIRPDFWANLDSMPATQKPQRDNLE